MNKEKLISPTWNPAQKGEKRLGMLGGELLGKHFESWCWARRKRWAVKRVLRKEEPTPRWEKSLKRVQAYSWKYSPIARLSGKEERRKTSDQPKPPSPPKHKNNKKKKKPLSKQKKKTKKTKTNSRSSGTQRRVGATGLATQNLLNPPLKKKNTNA